MGCGTSKHAVAPAPIVAMPDSVDATKAGKTDPAPQSKTAQPVADQKASAPASEAFGESSAPKSVAVEPKEQPVIPEPSQQPATNTREAIVFETKASLPNEIVEEPKAAPQTDEDRSNNSTPYASNQQDLGPTSPQTIDSDATSETVPPSADLPSVVEPLPNPVDVDSIKLPVHEDSVPYWEKSDPLPARPGTGTRRPPSAGGKGKIVVYKTAQTKKLEAEAKKKRHETGELPAPSPHRAKPSALPPLKERRKKTKSAASDETLVSAPVAPGRTWQGSGGGEAWSLDTSEFVAPAETDAGADPKPAASADVMAVDD